MGKINLLGKKNPQIVSFHAGVSFKTHFLHDACQEKSAVLCVSEVVKAKLTFNGFFYNAIVLQSKEDV